MGRLGSLFSAIGHRLRTLPLGVRVVIGVVALTVVGVASVLMYRTYNFVQHDNQFCLECHLMRDPFERFAQSAHRGLGCKACHRPNIIQRSEMGLAQIVEQPDSLRVHAVVPNEICAECHIRGNPEEWRRVANTAGHRIHLESDDPSLRGLMCVECHSSGVHQFTPTDQTCGQAGCHENVRVRLGKMGQLTIHCATCHDFAAPVPEDISGSELASSLRPEASECLSCHQMRSMLADFPEDEPHGAECGACHNPHEQTTPQQAVQSCARGGCHSQPDTLTPFHRGLDTGVLEECTACHKAHEFRIHGGGQECLSCHADIYQDAPNRTVSDAGRGARPASGSSIRLAATGDTRSLLGRLALARHPAIESGPDPSGPVPPVGAPQQPVPGGSPQDTVGFWHAQHRGVECTRCHNTTNTHGGLMVTSLQDCRSCHHTEPVVAACQECHPPADVRRQVGNVQRTLDIRVGRLNRPRRTLPFSHGPHTRLECTTCHNEGGAALSAANVNCSRCHDSHHEPEADCMACHHPPARGAHGLDVHVGCTGSGCHTDPPESVAQVPDTRSFCLVCHQDMTDHNTGRTCESCHTLPASRSQAAWTPAAAGSEPADGP